MSSVPACGPLLLLSPNSLPLFLVVVLLLFLRALLYFASSKRNPKNPASPVSVCVRLIFILTHTYTHLNTCPHIHQLKGTPLAKHTPTYEDTHTNGALFIENSKHRFSIIHSLMCHYVRLYICCLAFASLPYVSMCQAMCPRQIFYLMPSCYT